MGVKAQIRPSVADSALPRFPFLSPFPLERRAFCSIGGERVEDEPVFRGGERRAVVEHGDLEEGGAGEIICTELHLAEGRGGGADREKGGSRTDRTLVEGEERPREHSARPELGDAQRQEWWL